MQKKIFIRVLIILLLYIGSNTFGHQKWVDTIPQRKYDESTPQPVKPKVKLKDIEETETQYAVIMTLRNYEPGEIEHDSKEIFIQRVKTKIQELRVAKNIQNIVVVGWADGTINNGINRSKLKVPNDCIYVAKNEIVYDTELAKLRGCDIHRRLSSFMYNNSIKLSDLIDGQDEDDNINIGGAYRKVVIRIEFK
jgi:hypothetical protein